MFPDFNLSSSKALSICFLELEITTFQQACSYIQQLPYGRNESRNDFSLVLKEKKGTCSSKHAVLNLLALENDHPEVELILGIFLMSEKTHQKLSPILDQYKLTHIPEAHTYLRIQGIKYDFTSLGNSFDKIQKALIREQRCEANQLIEWKPNVHKHYLEAWAKRQKLDYSLDELWGIREKCIAELSR